MDLGVSVLLPFGFVFCCLCLRLGSRNRWLGFGGLFLGLRKKLAAISCVEGVTSWKSAV